MLPLFLAALAFRDPIASRGQHPTHRTIVLEVVASDPEREGFGAPQRVECTAEFGGTWFAWASAADGVPFLRVEDKDGTLVGEDADSGGARTPFLMLDVEPGTQRTFVVAVRGRLPIHVELHLVAAPESERTRAAVVDGQRGLAHVGELERGGELERARADLAAVLTDLLAADPNAESALVSELAWEAGAEALELGAADTARSALSLTVEVRERLLPPDHPALCEARAELAQAYAALGNLSVALELQERVLASHARSLPPDHRSLQAARLNFAVTLHHLGDFARARVVFAEVVDALEGSVPPDDPDLSQARLNLATAYKSLGDLHAARELEERVLEVYTRTLPDDHPDLDWVRGNLAHTLYQSGELFVARELAERVVDARARRLPDEHHDLATARLLLAATYMKLGDFDGARELTEKVFETRSRTRPEDHEELQKARVFLASVATHVGDFEQARRLLELALDARSRNLPDDALLVQDARSLLASTYWDLGDVARARDLHEQVLENYSRTLDGDHPALQRARLALAVMLAEQGEFARASELEEEAIEVWKRTLSADLPQLQEALSNHATTLFKLGDRAGSTACVRELAASVQISIRNAALRLAPRELEAFASSAAPCADTILSIAHAEGSDQDRPELEALGFGVVEGLRGVGLLGARIAGVLAVLPEARELVARVRSTSTRLTSLALEDGDRDVLTSVRRELEGAQRALLELPQTRNAIAELAREPSVDRFQAALCDEDALIAFWVCTREEFDPSSRATIATERILTAFIVRRDRPLACVDLGTLGRVVKSVELWRQALIGATRPDTDSGTDIVLASRGVPAVAIRGTTIDAAVLEAGEKLREILLDPLLPHLAGAHRWIVALDGPLHALPLDALPFRTGVLGDEFRIDVHPAPRELCTAPMVALPACRLVALGGIDYDAETSAPARAVDPLPGPQVVRGERHSVASPLVRSVRGDGGFSALPATALEVRSIARSFKEAFGDRCTAVVLEDQAATHAALEAVASSAGVLHLATHGWCAQEPIPSSGGARIVGAPNDPRSRELQVRGSSPMVLCGLALAGANLPADPIGRVRGVVTAGELATWDLGRCQLAVLSACDTSAGVARAGQGVASLQRALHMAGARSVITSLWKVRDDATKELMVDFYRRLWVERKPTHQALWEAKVKLREAQDERGAPKYTTRDWAAWVLTGSPD